MNDRISLQDLSALLAEKAAINKKDAEVFLREYFEVMNEELIKNRLLKIKDLGTFKLSLVEDRESIDVTTGERVLIPSHYKVVFIPDKKLAEIVNEPFALFETVEIDEKAETEGLKLLSKEDVSEDSESTLEEEEDDIVFEKSLIKDDDDEEDLFEKNPIRDDEDDFFPKSLLIKDDDDDFFEKNLNDDFFEKSLLRDDEDDFFEKSLIEEDNDNDDDLDLFEESLIDEDDDDDLFDESLIDEEDEDDDDLFRKSLIDDDDDDIFEKSLMGDDDDDLLFEKELAGSKSSSSVVEKEIVETGDDSVSEEELADDEDDGDFEEELVDEEGTMVFEKEPVNEKEEGEGGVGGIMALETIPVTKKEEEDVVFEKEPMEEKEEDVTALKEPESITEEEKSMAEKVKKTFCLNCHDYEAHRIYKKKYYATWRKLNRLRAVIAILSVLLLAALGYIAYIKFFEKRFQPTNISQTVTGSEAVQDSVPGVSDTLNKNVVSTLGTSENPNPGSDSVPVVPKPLVEDPGTVPKVSESSNENPGAVTNNTSETLTSSKNPDSATKSKKKGIDEETIVSKTSSDSKAKQITVARGQRLTLIALEEYGDKAFWVYIYLENKAILPDPGVLPVGIRLSVPPADKYGIDCNDPASVQKAKELAGRIL